MSQHSKAKVGRSTVDDRFSTPCDKRSFSELMPPNVGISHAIKSAWTWRIRPPFVGCHYCETLRQAYALAIQEQDPFYLAAFLIQGFAGCQRKWLKGREEK